MSVAQSDVSQLRAWWSPFHLWRQFIVAVALAVSCFLLGWYLVKLGFSTSSFDMSVVDKDAALPIAFGGVVIASALIFDACWLAGLLGASWKGALLFPIRPRFWRFAFAWVIIDLLFVSTYLQLGDILGLIKVHDNDAFNLGKFIASLGIGLPVLALVWIRFRLVLWPIHVLATGRMGELQTPWQMTGGRNGSLFDLSIGMIFASITLLATAVAVVLALAPRYFGDSAYVSIPFIGLAILLLFRSLQLSAFAERYQLALSGDAAG